MANPFKKREVGPGPLKALRDHPVEPVHLLSDREQLASVRKDRWRKLLKSFDEPRTEILSWAEQMAAVHGPEVIVWQNQLDWVTALYVVRYGENEAYWPRQFSDHDVRRAIQWQTQQGALPKGVRYVSTD